MINRGDNLLKPVNYICGLRKELWWEERVSATPPCSDSRVCSWGFASGHVISSPTISTHGLCLPISLFIPLLPLCLILFMHIFHLFVASFLIRSCYMLFLTHVFQPMFCVFSQSWLNLSLVSFTYAVLKLIFLPFLFLQYSSFLYSLVLGSVFLSNRLSLVFLSHCIVFSSVL